MKKILALLFIVGVAHAEQCNTSNALVNLRPGAEWVLSSENYKTLQWMDKKQTKPSAYEVKSEINACIARKTNRENDIRMTKDIAFDKSRSDKERLEALSKLMSIYSK